MDDDERGERLVRAMVDASNARDWTALAGVVAPGFVRHSHAAPGVESREDLLHYLQAELETFPDAQETIEDMIAAAGKVAVRHRFTGTQLGRMGPYPPSGKVMTADYLAIYRIEDDMIAEAWAEWDNLSGLAQLGHFPSGPPAG
jgi:steroid delta-isomerase-like uncharacterized protein